MADVGSFRDYQTAREAATLLLVLGFAALIATVSDFILAWVKGYGPLGWMGWYVGPITLGLALLMIPPGLVFAKKAKRIHPSE